MEKVIRDSGINTAGSIFNKSVQLLAYADDIVILARSTIAMKEAFILLERAAEKFGLAINEEKTKYMCISKRRNDRQNITIDTYNIEGVNEFIYLGTLISKDNDTTAEVKRRLALANRSYFGLRKHFLTRNISRSTKVKLYRTLIRPILLYGSETWTLRNNEEQLLGCFERKILRTIYGGVNENDVWRRRYNHELYQLYKDPNIIKTIRINRIRWVGHVERSSDDSITKIIMNKRPDGHRDTGRPRRRYTDSVEEDLRTLGIRNWRLQSRDRQFWRRMLQEAKANNRLWSY